MADNILLITNDMNPTAEIVIQSLRRIAPNLQIKIASPINVCLKDIYSGSYKIIVLRLCDPASLPLLMLMKQADIPYVYYLDDNLWEIKGNNPLGRFHLDPKVLATLTAFVQQAHYVVAASSILKDYIYPINANVVHISAGFDFDLVKNITANSPDSQIKILYAGSLYRDQDFVPVIPAIKQIIKEFDHQITFHFYGYIPDALKGLPNIVFDGKFYKYNDFIKKQYAEGFDIGMAPLKDSPSNRAKTELKFREYGACGIAGIYSNIPPYSMCVTHSINGLLVGHQSDDWYQALKLLIMNSELRKNIQHAAAVDVLNNYDHNRIAINWRKLLDQLPSHQVKLTNRKRCTFRIRCFTIFSISKLKRIHNYYLFHGFAPTLKKILKDTMRYE